MIYVSTGGFRDQTPLQSIASLQDSGLINIELSGGGYTPGLAEGLLEVQESGAVNLQIHNYFPPPEEPFVLNLGSANPQIADRSLSHVRNAIELARRIGSFKYSFHAGFLIDPKVDELGKRIGKRRVLDRSAGLETFIERVGLLATAADSAGVELLIENNVVSSANFQRFGIDPLLMTRPEECRYVMENTPANVNMLLDVAHLKVSARTLEFDAADMFTQCGAWIRACHLSDNDGLEDQNRAVTEDSWFWPYLDRELDYYSLEVYTNVMGTLSAQCELVQSQIAI